MAEEKGKVNIFEGTMAHMTYLQIEEAAREGTSVLFPIGVIEEHGPHLPLAVDVYGSYLQSRGVKSELERKGIKSLIAPPFYWGINVATGSFGGSFKVVGQDGTAGRRQQGHNHSHPLFGKLIGELLPLHPRFDSHPAVVSVDLQNLFHPGEVEDDPPLLWNGRPAEMDVGTDRHHGDGAPIGELDNLCDLMGIFWLHDVAWCPYRCKAGVGSVFAEDDRVVGKISTPHDF